MDCSLPGSSVHGIFQARVLELVAISFSRGSSQPRDRTRVSCIADALPSEPPHLHPCNNKCFAFIDQWQLVSPQCAQLIPVTPELIEAMVWDDPQDRCLFPALRMWEPFDRRSCVLLIGSTSVSILHDWVPDRYWALNNRFLNPSDEKNADLVCPYLTNFSPSSAPFTS